MIGLSKSAIFGLQRGLQLTVINTVPTFISRADNSHSQVANSYKYNMLQWFLHYTSGAFCYLFVAATKCAVKSCF